MKESLKILIASLFIGLYVNVFSQSEIRIFSGKITDVSTGKPVAYANIKVLYTLSGTVSDSLGKFEIKTKKKDITISISCIGYETKQMTLVHQSEIFLIELTPGVIELSGVTVNSSPVEIIKQHKTYSIIDYHFHEDQCVLLSFEKRKSEAEIFLMSEEKDTLFRMTSPEKSSGFFKDCMGNIHLTGTENVYQLHFRNDSILLHPPATTKKFEQILKDCAGEDDRFLYYVSKAGTYVVETRRFIFPENNHIMDYFAIEKSTGEKKHLFTITDRTAMKNSKRSFDLNRKYAEAGLYRERIHEEYDNYFAESILYDEIYAPLFSVDDSIYVFDFVNSEIVVLQECNLSHSVSFSFHTENDWKKDVYYDPVTSVIYTAYETNGITSLKPVNLRNGKTDNPVEISKAFVENIKIYDGYVYFLYNDKTGSTTKYLSRIHLN